MMAKIKSFMILLPVKWKEIVGRNKKKAYLIPICVIIVLLIAGITSLILLPKKKEVTYRETKAVFGNLTVGVTETGNVSIGVSAQTFDVDISEYTGSSDISWDMGTSEGAAMAQMFQNTAAEENTSDTGRSLVVEEVYAAAGQTVEEGTALAKVTAESAETIKAELQEDAADAKITYEQELTDGKQIILQAESELSLNQAYGEYKEAEYTKTVNELLRSVEAAEEELEEKKEELLTKQAETEEIQNVLAEQPEVLKNAEYARDNTSREDNLYWWITAVNTVSDTKNLIETADSNINTLNEEIEQLEEDIESLNTELSIAKKTYKTGEAAAETEKKLKQYQYENAQEIYFVTVEQSSFNIETAKEEYEEAQQKMIDFESLIIDGIIASEYSGVITEIGIAAGESLTKGSAIITLNDYKETQIGLSIEEEDMEYAALGNEVNITFSAFPDTVWKGEISEIGNAEINSNTNTTTYSVTVDVKGDIEGLYEGMSAEVTFITNGSVEVLYVANRSIIKEGTESFVKVRNEAGNIIKQKVVTGFSNGINVEIKEGLSEGDIVLIESSIG